jgi:hypothetical protein
LSLAMTAIAFEPRRLRISSESRFRMRLTASPLGLISSLPLRCQRLAKFDPRSARES